MWAFWRRSVYILSFLIIIVGAVLFFFQEKLFPEARCDDGIKNGFESGLDCGGVCALRCRADTVPLTVEWAKSFPSGEGRFDVVAFVNNKNTRSAPLWATTTISFFNEEGTVLQQIVFKDSVSFGSDYPIILQNITLAETPSRTTASVEEAPSYLVTNKEADPISYTTVFDSEGRRAITATIKNTSKKQACTYPDSSHCLRQRSKCLCSRVFTY